MSIKRGNKRTFVTLNKERQHEIDHLAKKYNLSQSKILAHALDKLYELDQAKFPTGLKIKK